MDNIIIGEDGIPKLIDFGRAAKNNIEDKNVAFR
jgi:serine/threonine protein kinase